MIFSSLSNKSVRLIYFNNLFVEYNAIFEKTLYEPLYE